MKKFIKRERVVELLAEGWELAVGSYIRGGAYAWMQKRIGHGGESHYISMITMNSMIKRGQVVMDRKASDWRKTLYKLAARPQGE